MKQNTRVYCHWMRWDRAIGQGGGVTVCHREDLQVQLLSVQSPEDLETLFFCLLLADKSGILLCTIYRPARQGEALYVPVSVPLHP